ncbi:hypothetical protein BDY21DRAFT_375123 [Lineolata rhizophorae]|uniref:Uncharacterized protein n=1 Tax=Lineolata rhizophorae TaxID=578093 RepID=A0A6A6NN19_9PEZI|nr:hypothetical protein BDY21DRAFT_375123 [Lineolata rhizophorae]
MSMSVASGYSYGSWGPPPQGIDPNVVHGACDVLANRKNEYHAKDLPERSRHANIFYRLTYCRDGVFQSARELIADTIYWSQEDDHFRYMLAIVRDWNREMGFDVGNDPSIYTPWEGDVWECPPTIVLQERYYHPTKAMLREVAYMGYTPPPDAIYDVNFFKEEYVRYNGDDLGDFNLCSAITLRGSIKTVVVVLLDKAQKMKDKAQKVKEMPAKISSSKLSSVKGFNIKNLFSKKSTSDEPGSSAA